MKNTTLTNPVLQNFTFLTGMFADDYFPDFLVEKGRQILIGLCEKIEQQKPATAEEMYALTHAATEEFNVLGGEFTDNNSEIESVARDVIGSDFGVIVKAYGFDLDIERVIALREW